MMGDNRGGRGGGSGYQGRGFGCNRGGFDGNRGRGRGGYGGDHGATMPEMARHPILVRQPLSPGREGRPIDLVANFYKFTTSDIDVYHYDVAIKKKRTGSASDSPTTDSSSPSPDSPPSSDAPPEQKVLIKRFSSKIVEKMAENVSFRGCRYIFDDIQNLYLTKGVELLGKQSRIFPVTIDIDGRPNSFEVKVKLVERVAVNEIIEYYRRKKDEISERTISIYETMFRFIMGKQYDTFHRKFMDTSTAQCSSKDLLADFVQGFTSAVRTTEFGVALNLHLKTSCINSVRYDSLLGVAKRLIRFQPGQKLINGQLIELNKYIRHLKIFTKHTEVKHLYTIDGIVDKTPWDMTFYKKDKSSSVRISDYFKEKYDITLQNNPLVKTMGRHGKYIPFELCYLVPNQFLSNAKIDSAIQGELLLRSTHTPNVYFNKLDTFINKIASKEMEIQANFGVQLETRPVQFQGRVLPAPRQINGDPRGPFYRSSAYTLNWSFITFDETVSRDDLSKFAKSMRERAEQLGIQFNEDPYPLDVIPLKDLKMVETVMYNIKKRTNASLIFVGIPLHHKLVSPAAIYSQVKLNGDQAFGIMTQCFNTEKLKRPPGGYFDNFLLKVNGKLGGLNAVLDDTALESLPFSPSQTMIVGIDVNHPSETEILTASVVAAVGSLDHQFSSYAASIRLQKKEKDEIVKCLDDMLYELFLEYQKINQVFPTNLIIFRDGVSDGQFEKVVRTEAPLVQAAANKVGTKMKVVIIITQKHHNTRFALTQANTQRRTPTWNVPSGTVVDTAIVDPLYKMFYLNSHFSPLGTSRPTKYCILRDDLNMTADNLQKLCFLACYNSIRTRSVIAIPTAVRYADLCAYRSKLHIEAQRQLLQFTRGNANQDDLERQVLKRLNELVKVDSKIQNRLYYC